MEDGTHDDRTDVRALGLRVALVYPALIVGPLVVLFFLITLLPGSDLDDIAWGFIAGPVAAIVSAIVCARAAAGAAVTGRYRALLGALALVGTLVGFLLGVVGWWAAAEKACGDQYECPF